MCLTPLYEKIIIKIDDKQEMKSETGLQYVQNMSSSKNTIIKGEVVAVGDGRLLADGKIIPPKVKVGDRVIYSKIQGESYSDTDGDFTILSESNILAIIKENDNNENN